MTTNSPSGNRRAVGRSTIPGKPKLPTKMGFASLAAAQGTNNDVNKIISDTEVFIFINFTEHQLYNF